MSRGALEVTVNNLRSNFYIDLSGFLIMNFKHIVVHSLIFTAWFFFLLFKRKNKIYSYESYTEVFHLPVNSLFLSKLLTCIYSSKRNHIFVRQGVIVEIRNIKTEFLAFTVSYSPVLKMRVGDVRMLISYWLKDFMWVNACSKNVNVICVQTAWLVLSTESLCVPIITAILYCCWCRN